MFRHRRKLSRWAAHVLLVWLFGVAVGIAHACVVAPKGDAHHDRISIALVDAQIGDHEHDTGTIGDANCVNLSGRKST